MVPLRILKKESLSPGIIDFLSNNTVFLLGYHELPEQTPLDQARMEFEDKMKKHLDSIKKVLEENGADVETKMVFTHDEEETVERVSGEEEVDAILIANPSMEIKDVLVILTDKKELSEITVLLEVFSNKKEINITTAFVGKRDEGEDPIKQLNRFLKEREFDLENVGLNFWDENELFEKVNDYDLIVMGEVEKKFKQILFDKELPEKVADTSLGPVLIAMGRGKGGG